MELTKRLFYSESVDIYLEIQFLFGYGVTYIYTGSSQLSGAYRTAVYNAIERGRATVSSDGSLLIHKITKGDIYLPCYYMQKSYAGYVTVNVYAKRVISKI